METFAAILAVCLLIAGVTVGGIILACFLSALTHRAGKRTTVQRKEMQLEIAKLSNDDDRIARCVHDLEEARAELEGKKK